MHKPVALILANVVHDIAADAVRLEKAHGAVSSIEEAAQRVTAAREQAGETARPAAEPATKGSA